MSFDELEAKADWVRYKTLEMHKVAPGTRVASSLSPVDILTTLYYGGLLRQNPANTQDPTRDRLIASKGHGSLCLYPILADLGFFSAEELEHVGNDGCLLGVIPEQAVPGIETTNGSLGHGPGVACGMAIGLKRRNNPATVFVLCGDGEMNSGAVWEAVMFASAQKLDNLVLIVDDNGRSMLGYQKDIMGLDPLVEKFKAFHWSAEEVDGHNIPALMSVLSHAKAERNDHPKAIICKTVKGHRIPELETDPLAHIRILSPQRVDEILETWK